MLPAWGEEGFGEPRSSVCTAVGRVDKWNNGIFHPALLSWTQSIVSSRLYAHNHAQRYSNVLLLRLSNTVAPNGKIASTICTFTNIIDNIHVFTKAPLYNCDSGETTVYSNMGLTYEMDICTSDTYAYTMQSHSCTVIHKGKYRNKWEYTLINCTFALTTTAEEAETLCLKSGIKWNIFLFGNNVNVIYCWY